jgi:hypothetical protein
MSSRALSLAAVMLLIGCLAAASAQAENLDAGKSPSQIFAGTCSECHKSSRGLLRKVPAGSLPGFLRQHYTTGGQMAAVLSAYLIANGAADRRPPPPDGQPKPGTDAKPDEAKPADQADRRGRRRLVRPGEAPDAAKPGDDVPGQSASERGPDGRKLRRGRPGSEELPKTDAAKTDTSKTDGSKTDTAKTDASKTDAAKDEPSKGEPAKDVKPASETAKGEDNKPEGTPSGEGRSEAAKEAVKIDAPKATGEAPVLRADPVPPVTPAPAAAAAPPAATSSAAPERAPEPPAPALPSAPPSVTASAPPPAPAGPPAPPISQ